jgi:uncharacterized protein (TIRG00374 family)
MNQWLRLAVGVAISLVFVYGVVAFVGNLGSAVTSLQQANYLYVLPALVAYFAGVWLRAVRWRYLLRPIKAVPSGRLFPVVVIGYMANDVLPARLGEVVRAYVLGEQEDVAKSTTLVTIVVERLFDGLAMVSFVAFVLVTSPLNQNAAQIGQVLRLGAILFIAVLVVLFLIGSSRERGVRLIERVEASLPSAARGKLAPVADRLLHGLASLQNPRLALLVLGFSLGAWLCEAAMYTIIARGFGLELGFPAFMLTTAVANLAAMIPAAPGYVGTFDLAAVTALGLYGAPRGTAVAFVAVLHVALLVPVTLLGFFYLWRAKLSLRILGQLGASSPVASTSSQEVSP